jgi:putative oxygen-independent coproporphyrinogen III oxidase
MTNLQDQCEPQPACDPGEPAEGNLFVSAYPPFSCWGPKYVDQIDRMLGTASNTQVDVPLGLYVHIPFCVERCHFCYYRSFADPNPGTLDSYLDSLINEIRIYSETPRLAGRKLAFVYFGGGTPSLLSVIQLRRLFQAIQSAFPWTDVKEVTFECSPKTVTHERLATLHQAGVTRISMGVQQMNDDVLKQSGRVHLVDDIRRAWAAIRQFDFDVVNIDLMVGMVGETEETFCDSLRQVIAMNADSVTLYQLEIPRNTPLFRALRKNEVSSLASWDVKRARLTAAFAMLEADGYTLRSAYAAVRDPLRHVFQYQDLQYHGADLVGTGLASFSFVAGTHYQNIASLREYNESLAANRLPYNRGYVLNEEEQAVREFILQLKLGQVRAAYFQDKFGIDIAESFSDSLKRFASGGLLTVDADGVTLTRQGLVRVDRMLPEFYLPQHREASFW